MIALGSLLVFSKDIELTVPVTSETVLFGEDDAVDALSGKAMRPNFSQVNGLAGAVVFVDGVAW